MRCNPNEGDSEEKERFLNDLDGIVDRGDGYRLCTRGDMNGWIGNKVRTDITGAFGVPRENDNGRRVVKFSAERGCMVNTSSTRVSTSTQKCQGTNMEWR